jgi:acyl-CoA synthetase (AMP-forming)/AMP-acid ligase II
MNVGSFLAQSARLYPNHLAVAQGRKRLTYRQFNARCNRLANALHRLGVRPGENVALLQYNCPEMLETLFACFKAGFGAVPINFRLHPEEYAYIINHSEAKAVVLTGEFNEAVLEIRDRIPEVRHLITVSGAKDELLGYERLLSDESDRWNNAETMPESVAWLFYTSGTTGKPKGAMLTHRNLLAMTLTYYADYSLLGTNDAILHAAPLSHGSGLYALPNIAKGAVNAILESKSFDPEEVLKTIERSRITNMFAAPTMTKLLIDCPAIDKYNFSSMKNFVYGGGPTHVEDLKEAIERLGPCLTQLYGLGETPMTVTYLPHEDHVLEGTDKQMKRLAAAGIPRTGVEVKIFDPNDQEVAVGEMGEVVARSDVVMKGYWRDPEATAETLRNGWLHTGDLGYMDEDGYLYLMDRSKDMIVSGGENIYPREIEEVIIRHPAIREVAVIGVPDPKWGEAVKAVVSMAPGASITEEELIAFCKDHIASYKKPKSFDFVDELPKNNYGKIMKRELRARYWEGRKRHV